MWKELIVRLFIGVGGLALGALFVLGLRGAALADSQRLAQAQTQSLVALQPGAKLAQAR